MSKYTVASGQEFNYPADLQSQQIIKSRGGRSKLTESDKDLVTYKIVTEGQDCSDMPEDALKLYLSRGWVIEETAQKPVEVPTTELGEQSNG